MSDAKDKTLEQLIGEAAIMVGDVEEYEEEGCSFSLWFCGGTGEWQAGVEHETCDNTCPRAAVVAFITSVKAKLTAKLDAEQAELDRRRALLDGDGET